jgi:hypothetical protein
MFRLEVETWDETKKRCRNEEHHNSPFYGRGYSCLPLLSISYGSVYIATLVKHKIIFHILNALSYEYLTYSRVEFKKMDFFAG